jgi:hypothetical protein
MDPKQTTFKPSSSLNATSFALRPEHHGAQQRVGVFQRKIPVSRTGRPEIRYLALNPDIGEIAVA